MGGNWVKVLSPWQLKVKVQLQHWFCLTWMNTYFPKHGFSVNFIRGTKFFSIHPCINPNIPPSSYRETTSAHSNMSNINIKSPVHPGLWIHLILLKTCLIASSTGISAYYKTMWKKYSYWETLILIFCWNIYSIIYFLNVGSSGLG